MINNYNKVAVIGLGYVGLPLAVAFSKELSVLGLDINRQRIVELQNNYDVSDEVSYEELAEAKITYSTEFSHLKDCNFIIVTVPTPVDENKIPDLSYLKIASEKIGENMSRDSVIVYESTVYPGVTEDVCLPILEKTSGLKHPADFKIGYSPERINPGDKIHTVDKVIKIIGADCEETLTIMENIYSKVVRAGLFKASSIKTAEMAKVIENTQRDINIALMNEISLICEKLNLRSKEVLDAAGTKWNFLKFHPGLVGGHCIGVDPYYLTYKCEELNYHPQMILSGRRINDSMGKYVAEIVIKKLIGNNKPVHKANVLVLGATFKENIRDIRNSKVVDIIKELKDYSINVFLNDPYANPDDVNREFSTSISDFTELKNLDCIILAVPHKAYEQLDLDYLLSLCQENPIFIDIKSHMDKSSLEAKGFTYWSL